MTIISNNAKGLKKRYKRLRLIEYLNKHLSHEGIIFLQETHSKEGDEMKWRNDFKGPVFYSHGTSNSCGVLTAYLGSRKFILNKTLKDKRGRILILDANIDDVEYILINIYNANTETEQVKVLQDLNDLG